MYMTWAWLLNQDKIWKICKTDKQYKIYSREIFLIFSVDKIQQGNKLYDTELRNEAMGSSFKLTLENVSSWGNIDIVIGWLQLIKRIILRTIAWFDFHCRWYNVRIRIYAVAPLTQIPWSICPFTSENLNINFMTYSSAWTIRTLAKNLWLDEWFFFFINTIQSASRREILVIPLH